MVTVTYVDVGSHSFDPASSGIERRIHISLGVLVGKLFLDEQVHDQLPSLCVAEDESSFLVFLVLLIFGILDGDASGKLPVRADAAAVGAEDEGHGEKMDVEVLASQFFVVSLDLDQELLRELAGEFFGGAQRRADTAVLGKIEADATPRTIAVGLRFAPSISFSSVRFRT